MIEETSGLTPKENKQAETEILKLKLETESGAVIFTSGEFKLPAEVELDWYNHIYNYEKLCKEAGYAKVYDLIGKPLFKNLEDLEFDQVEKELDHLLEKMYSKGVILNYDYEEYKAPAVYKFVTEELFYEDINCYIEPGGHRVFDYEEFYPNHKKDLTRYSEEYLEDLFGTKKWSPEYLHLTHGNYVLVNGQEMTLKEYSDVVVLFQFLKLKDKSCDWTIEEIEYDLSTSLASVKGNCVHHDGVGDDFIINFTLCYGVWVISGVGMNGLEV